MENEDERGSTRTGSGEVVVCNMDLRKLVKFFMGLDKSHFHDRVHFTFYDGQIRQIVKEQSLNLRQVWPVLENTETGDST